MRGILDSTLLITEHRVQSAQSVVYLVEGEYIYAKKPCAIPGEGLSLFFFGEGIEFADYDCSTNVCGINRL